MSIKPHRSSSHITPRIRNLAPNPNYRCVKLLGLGTFGAVFLAYDKNNRTVAIKKVLLDPKYKNRELEIVSCCHHPNILHYITHYITTEGSHNHQFLHLVTEFVPTSLPAFLAQNPQPDILWIQLFGFQMFSGLSYLHKKGICHRDIKPSNVLVDTSDGRLQICDFGSAKILLPQEESVSYIATRFYRAPELLLDCPFYSPAVDVWAAGCVLAEIFMNGKTLFSGSCNSEMLSSIIRIIGNPKQSDLSSYIHRKYFSPMAITPITLKEALPRSIPSKFLDLLQKIFVYNPTLRLPASQCMEHPFFADIFNPNQRLPNGMVLPTILSTMNTYEVMIKNYQE